MKILFLAKGDFITKQNTGGLHGTYRNYKLLNAVVGKENVFSYILTDQKKENAEHIIYHKYKSSLLHRYFLYFRLRELLSLKDEMKIVKYIINNNFDIVFFDGSLNGRIAKKLPTNIKKIVYFHNIEKYLFEEFYKKKSILFYIRYLSAKYNEKLMTNYSNAIICLNIRDNKLLYKYYNKYADLIMPVTFCDTYNENQITKNSSESYFLFVGSYFEPNIQGILWFVQNVAPYIKSKIKIVGKGMECLNAKIQQHNIEIIGGVKNLKEYYVNAEAVVMPIFMGAGMKVKTAEALMYGKTIFASDEALEGYEIENKQFIYRCNTSEEFVKEINCYINLENKSKMNQQVRDLFLNKYETNNYMKPLKNLIESL